MKQAINLFIVFTAKIIYPFWSFKEKYLSYFHRKLTGMLVQQKLKRSGCKIGDNMSIGKGVDIRIGKNSTVIIGNNVKIGEGVYIKVKERAKLIIGDNVHINQATRLSSNLAIEIGDDTLIAPYCNVLDHNHMYDLKTPVSSKLFDNAGIIIGKGVWLGVRVQVNKGVTIGNFSVVGANAVVTKDIPEATVFGGIPAKKLK